MTGRDGRASILSHRDGSRSSPEEDLRLFAEGRHTRLYERLGAHTS